MDLACLEHRLTPDERIFIQKNGYLIIPNALDPAMRARLETVVDRIDARERTPETVGKLMSVANVIHEDDALLDLLDWPRVFPKVWGVLGWNIRLYHSHLDTTPPENAEAQKWAVAWHQDSMRVNDEIESEPRPRLSLKIGYYLSDISSDDRGNTLVLPGSHLQNKIELPQDGFSSPAGAVPVTGPAGTAVLLDRRVWHSRSANRSAVTRKVVWLGYSYRWLRAKDAMTVEHLYPRLDPVRRQLLGAGSNNSAYDPTDADVPLKGWLAAYDPEAAGDSPHGRAQSRPPAMVRGKNLGRT